MNPHWIDRPRYSSSVENALRDNPICALLGPRQCGKTRLARHIAQDWESVKHFDLESSAHRIQLQEPELALAPLKGLVIIDEIQRQPGLFTTLRPLADRESIPARFLILGSASPSLVKGVSESLAGRVGFVDLAGFDLREVAANSDHRLWLRGGFPRSFLADNDSASLRWRHDFIRTFLEQDLPNLGFRLSAEMMRRFWMMLAHYHGQLWNGAELARSLAVTQHTVRHWLDVLTGTYLVRQLPPWHANIGKRQYKSPKVYVRDSGLLNALLDLGTLEALHSHPKVGAAWEGFALEQILRAAGSRDAYFWRTHAGAEIDLVLMRAGRLYGFEFKRADAPRLTPSLKSALHDLNLERIWIVAPTVPPYAVHDRVDVVPLGQAIELAATLGV